MPACSSNVNVCGEYFVQALLPYLRVHERFRWGQLNQLARSMVYTPFYEEKAMVESLRLSLGHLDADPQNLMYTVPPECGTDDTSRLWWLGQKLTNWHMYGARFNHIAMKRAARARAYEVQRLLSFYSNESEQACTCTGSELQRSGTTFRRNMLVADDKREHSYGCDEIGDPVLNDLAMRFTYYDTMKCRRRWDPEDRSLAPCTSSMNCDFNSLNDRILPLYDDHVCLNLTIIPLFRQQASMEEPSSAFKAIPPSTHPLMTVDHSMALRGAKSSHMSHLDGGLMIDEGRFRPRRRSRSPVRGTVRINYPSSSSSLAKATAAPSDKSNASPFIRPAYQNRRHLPQGATSLLSSAHFAKETTAVAINRVFKTESESTPSSIGGCTCRSLDDDRSWTVSSTAASTPRRCPVEEPYIQCVVQPDDLATSTRLGNTFKQLGEYLNCKNFYHDDIFVPFVIKALLNNPYWAHELVHKGYPMEVLFWAWGVCSDATLFNGVTKLPAPVRYRFPGSPSLLLASPSGVPPPPLSPLATTRHYANSRISRHKDRYGTVNKVPNSVANAQGRPEKSSFQFRFQYNSSIGGFDPAKLVSNRRRKPWEFHPWNATSITDYINPQEENQLKLDRKLCVQAHSYLCCSLLFDIQSRIHKLYGGKRHASSPVSKERSCSRGNMDLVISCFWDPSAHRSIKLTNSENKQRKSSFNLHQGAKRNY